MKISSSKNQEMELNATATEIPNITRFQILKNFSVICLAFYLLFISHNSILMLESTINSHGGTGVISLAVFYLSFAICSFMLPKYIIHKFGCKITLVASFTGFIPYIAANFYFDWLTFVPASIINGLAAACLWCAESIYVNELAAYYSLLTIIDNSTYANTSFAVPTTQCSVSVLSHTEKNYGGASDMNLHRNNSTFDELDCNKGSLKQICPSPNVTKVYTGDICNDSFRKCVTRMKKSIYYLHNGNTDNQDTRNTFNFHDLNNKKMVAKAMDIVQMYHAEKYQYTFSWVTAMMFGIFDFFYKTTDVWGNLLSYYVIQDGRILDNIYENKNCSCGAHFCNIQIGCFEHNLAEPDQKLKNILTFTYIGIAVVGMVILFIFMDNLGTKSEPVKFSFDIIVSTLNFIRKRDSLLLLPISVFSGLVHGFYIADFTKAFVACPWGVHHVGLVAISYGSAAGISATLSGIIVKYFGRIAVMLLGAVINVTACIFCLTWNPDPNDPELFFLVAGMWGAVLGLISPQIKAYYGVLFEKDSNCYVVFYLLDAVGYIMSFAYSNYICIDTKIYILLAVSTLGIIGYISTEIVDSCRKR